MWTTSIGFLRKFTRSLSFKLSFYAGLLMFVAVVAFAYHTISGQEESLIQEKIDGARTESEVIKAAIWNGMMTKDRQVIREIVKAIGSREGFKEINIYDEKGVLHYTSEEDLLPQVGKVTIPLSNPLYSDLGTNTAVRYRFADDGEHLKVINPLRNTKSCSTSSCHAHPESNPVLGVLEVNIPLGKLRAKINHNTRETILFALGLFFLISTIIGLAIIFGVLPPIKRLQENARKMARGQYVPQPNPVVGSDEVGELSRVFDEMSREINERTRQLDESRLMFKELFDKVPCYLNVITPDFRVAQANQAFVEEFGDQVGQLCYRGFKGLDSKCNNCLVEKTFQDGLSHRSDEMWTLGNGEKEVHVVVHTSPIFGHDGKVSAVMEMSVDVTRLERLQLELRKKEEQFRNLFENVPCYLTVVDKTFRIAFFNKMFGRDFGGKWGQHCYKVYKNRDSKCENCPVDKTFEDGTSHTCEDVWQRNGGEEHIVIHTSPITDDNGNTVAVMEMCTNITELKLLQNELAILGETIAGMSHTVKNILAGLEGGVYVVDSGLKSGKQDRIATGWGMVKKNVEKVSDLVKDILYASKEREPEYRICDPGKTLSEVFELYHEKARAQRIELIQDFHPEMGHGLFDPNGLHSAVSNLVSNAVAACTRASAGERMHHVTLTGRIEHGDLIVKVADDGIGMPDEVKQNLFKKFYSTKGSKGTGLGLVVTRKIVEEHAGSIEVESTQGEGTCFTIKIPFREEDARANFPA